MSKVLKDSIYLRNLQLSAKVGLDAWGRAGKPQPLTLSLRLHRDTSRAGESDAIQDTFNYGQMCKDIIDRVEGHDFPSLDALVASIAEISEAWSGESLSYQATLPKGLLRAEGGLAQTMAIRRSTATSWQRVSSHWSIHKIKAACIIGVNPHERLEKQVVSVDLQLSGMMLDHVHAPSFSQNNETFRNLVRTTVEILERSEFETLEALAAFISQSLLDAFSFPEITVSVEKPNALNFVEASGVEMTRARGDLMRHKIMDP